MDGKISLGCTEKSETNEIIARKMKQEKTALEWFDMLIEPYRSQAKENVTDERLQNFYPKLHYALIATFTWEDTAQGHDYWSGVVESLELNETTYLKPTQPQFGTWISVEDGLPNEGENVLLYSKQSDYVGVGYLSSIGWKNTNDDFVNNITHYMPLPPNPTK